MYEYFIWLAIFCLMPILVLWGFHYNYLKKHNFIFILIILCSLVFAIPWDLIAVKEEIWYFTQPQIIGIWLFGLPLEEYFFIILEALFVSTLTFIFIKKFGVKK